MKNYIKWILIVAGLFFVFAVYKSENKRLKELRITKKGNTFQDTTTIIRNQIPKNNNNEHKKPLKIEKRIYVVETSGDTLDLSKDKFIMISADKYRDKNITYGFSIWYDMNTCAWSPGILKISVYNKYSKLLKTSTANIDKQLGESCMQLEELNLFMGNLIDEATFINAEFTDDRGVKYIQTRKRLGDIVDLKPSTDNLTKEERLALKNIKQEIKILFDELLNFKDKEDFHLYGFSPNYRYNKWLQRVKTLKENPANRLLSLVDGFVVGDLEILGLEYLSSDGQETEYSIYAKEKIQFGLE